MADATVGPVTLERTYVHCPRCEQGEFAADRILGSAGYVTKGACRMACLLGVQQSFQKAEVAVLEVAGWKLDDNTIRRLCHAVAERASVLSQKFVHKLGQYETKSCLRLRTTQKAWGFHCDEPSSP